MSWEATPVKTTKADAYEDLACQVGLVAAGVDDPSQEVAEQVKAASEAAVQIIQSGCVGQDDDCRLVVSASGHANPNHAPRDGWANDMITVRISQT